MARREKQAVLTTVVQTNAPAAGYHALILKNLEERRVALDTALRDLAARSALLNEAAELLVETLRSGGRVLVAGNGGSAAEAQHFAGELVGRFKREREPYAVLPLTADTATLTAVANDYGYEEVFARQLLAFGRPGDLFIAFSTSGESENLVRAALAGRRGALHVLAITGERSSRLESLAHLTIRVPSFDTAIIQELHMAITHLLCEIVEEELAGQEGEA